MKFIKKSFIEYPKISLILLDWSVRESFHLLHYLSEQILPRNQFEVIIVEYYSTISPAIKKFESQVDTWILLEIPKSRYYHKHLMYNVGIAVAKGEFIIICDSDAMVKPSFLDSILLEFSKNPNIVLHVDQFRNNRRDLYPFCFPKFEEVIGKGCINNVNGKTRGLVSLDDPIHERNYGACLCARRSDLLLIGGADEHVDFVGHICGPYDLTFRLINLGRQEVWHQEEFLYHTWHPGQAGMANYLGPHDGRHMSTTSLEAIYYNRVLPHVMNPIITRLSGQNSQPYEIDESSCFVSQENLSITSPAFLVSTKKAEWADKTRSCFIYWGHRIDRKSEFYYASPILNHLSARPYTLVTRESSLIKHKIRLKVLQSMVYLSLTIFTFMPYFVRKLSRKFFRKIINLQRRSI